MTANKHAERFHGKPVQDFEHGDTIKRRDVTYRLNQDYDAKESQVELLDDFLSKLTPATIEALIIGAWSEAFETSPQPLLDRLVERQPELTELKALLVGDMSSEVCEISWIHQGSYAKLLNAYPMLEELCIRGTDGLALAPFEHHALRKFTIQCGGLPTSIVRNISKSTLPALRHLELWLGDDNYGFDGKLDDYVELLRRIRPERLQHLGLCNSQIADELAVHIAEQPWLGKLHTLDLSMGTIGDVGAKALLASPHIKGLKVLDLFHHYISDAVVAQLRKLPLELRIDEAQEEDDGDRYVEVGE